MVFLEMMWEGVVRRRRRKSLDLLHRKGGGESGRTHLHVLHGKEDVLGPAVGHLHEEGEVLQGQVPLLLGQGSRHCPGQILLHYHTQHHFLPWLDLWLPIRQVNCNLGWGRHALVKYPG